jgi:chorismate mutase
MGMDERRDRLARERQEIAARVAKFKATQDKFKREREEYCTTTLDNARIGVRSRRSLERTLVWP